MIQVNNFYSFLFYIKKKITNFIPLVRLGVNANIFPSGVQQLLAAIQPSLFNFHEAQTSNHQRCHSLSANSPSPNLMQNCSNDTTNMHAHTR